MCKSAQHTSVWRARIRTWRHYCDRRASSEEPSTRVSAQLLWWVSARRRSRWRSLNLRRPFLRAVSFDYLWRHNDNYLHYVTPSGGGGLDALFKSVDYNIEEVSSKMDFRVVYICSLLLSTVCWNYPVVTAQTSAPELRVFQGTLVHSRVSTEREVLQDHLIGVDENSGEVSERN